MTKQVISSIKDGAELTFWQTIKTGSSYSPELLAGVSWTLFWAFLGTAGRVVIPILMQQIIDQGLTSAKGVNYQFIATAIAIAVGCLMLTGFASRMMTARLIKAAELGLAGLRAKAFDKIQSLPLLTLNAQPKGGLVSRVTSDIDKISDFLYFGGITAVISVAQISLATLVMGFYSWQLTLVVWACFLPLWWSLKYFQPRLAVAYRKVQELVATLLSVVAEPIVGAEVVRSFAAGAHVEARISEAINAQKAANIKAQTLTAVSFSLAGLVTGFANAGVILVGIWLGTSHDLTMGQVLAFAFLVNLFVGPVQLATQVLNDAQSALAGWRRVIGVLQTESVMPDPGAKRQIISAAIPVKVTDLCFCYPGANAAALANLNFEIPAGARIALIGETGSGKSTLAKLLVRLFDPDVGSIELAGLNVAELSFQELRNLVVLVPQEGFLFAGSVAENLRLGNPLATDAEMQQAALDLGLAEWVSGLPTGLATQVGYRGENLSAGEKQLVALIRAKLADPAFLVLDEATSSVDPELEAQLSAALHSLMHGRTCVIVAHRLSTALKADQILLLADGELIGQGSHLELLANNSVYQKLFAAWETQIT